MKFALTAFLALASAGCTTTINYRAMDLDRSPFSSLKGKKIAIVAEASSLPDAVTTQSEAETFEFKGMATAIRDALKAQVEFSGAKAEVVETSTKPGFDFYLKPQLTVRSVYDFWTYGCLATYKLEVLGKKGEVISSASGEAKRNFVLTGQSEEKCNTALRILVGEINDKALSHISR